MKSKKNVRRFVVFSWLKWQNDDASFFLRTPSMWASLSMYALWNIFAPALPLRRVLVNWPVPLVWRSHFHFCFYIYSGLSLNSLHGGNINMPALRSICIVLLLCLFMSPPTFTWGKLFASGTQDLGWNGTGEVYPMVRVTLLHKSDGTASAPDTKLGTSGLRVSCINGGWALPCQLTVDGMILGEPWT